MERPNAGAEEDGREEELHEGEGGEVEVEAHQNGIIVEWPRSVRPFVLFLPTRTKGLKLLVPLLMMPFLWASSSTSLVKFLFTCPST